MVTKRVPLKRQSAAHQITPAALAIAERMFKLRCTCGNYPDRTKWTGRKQCRACEQWWDLHSQLADVVPHQPWQWPLLNPPTKYPDFDSVTGMFTDTLQPSQPNERQRAFEDVLRQAVRAMRVSRAVIAPNTEATTDAAAEHAPNSS
jgi:hypothetical protein